MKIKKYISKLINTAIKPLGVRAVFLSEPKVKRRRTPDWITSADGTKMSRDALKSFVRRVRESDLGDNGHAARHVDRVISEWANLNGNIQDHAIWVVWANMEIPRKGRYVLLSELQDSIGAIVVEDCEMEKHEVPEVMNLRVGFEVPASKLNFALDNLKGYAMVDSSGRTTLRVDSRFSILVP